MAHRLGRREDIGLGLRRLALDDLAAARADLASSESTGSTVASARRIRRRLKRTRSVLRALRPALGSDTARLSDGLRKAGRRLAEIRDNDAASADARSLEAAPEADRAGFERLVAMLDHEANDRHAKTASVAEVDRLLAAVEKDLSAFDGDVDGADLLGRAIDRAYRRGRIAMQRATFSLATPDLHAWRKSAKELRHLIRIARKRLPAAVGKRAADLQQIDEMLGLDHDHAMLAERLALSPEGDPTLMQQLSLIARRRRALEAEAFALGARLYRRKPKNFRRRLRLK